MTIFILDDASGIGSDDLDPLAACVDMAIIANDAGFGLNDPVGGMQLVTYNRTENGAPQVRLDTLVNTAFSPDFGSGAAQVDIIVIAGLSGFTLDDGTSFANNGTALPPASSGLPGAGLNTTENCLVIYDIQQNICVARDGTNGTIDLTISNPVVLYHEFSHAFRIVNNSLLGLGGPCNPSSPEENAAIVDENDMRTQIANRQGETAVLRDPGIHCGSVGCSSSGCCIIATVASKSLSSEQVQYLRSVRDHFVRSTEVGHAFFESFFHDYYAFSPQVCTIMAGNPRVGEHILEGYVNPLLDFWKIMIERSSSAFNPDQLARAFMGLHADLDKVRSRLNALHITESCWSLGTDGNVLIPEELIFLLKEHAWTSEHIQWALIKPVQIYHDLLALHFKGASDLELGVAFNEKLAEWAPDVPINDIWAALPVNNLKKELSFCDQALMKTAENRLRFRERLLARFGDITAIRRVIGEELLSRNDMLVGGTT